MNNYSIFSQHCPFNKVVVVVALVEIVVVVEVVMKVAVDVVVEVVVVVIVEVVAVVVVAVVVVVIFTFEQISSGNSRSIKVHGAKKEMGDFLMTIPSLLTTGEIISSFIS